MHLEVRTREPSGDPRPYEFLFIPGLAHAAWCWDAHFMPHLAARGVRSRAMSLRCHGESECAGSLNWIPMRDYLVDVRAVLDELKTAPVLIGHSAGAALIQRLLNERKFPGAVLLAPVPAAGLLPSSLRYARRHPVPFLRTLLTMNLRPLIGTFDLYKTAMYAGGLPDRAMEALYTRAQDESFRFFLDMLLPHRPTPAGRSTPVLVVGSTADHFFTAREFRGTAARYAADLEIVDGIGHMMMLDAGWERIAGKIFAWAETQIAAPGGGKD